MSVQHIPYKLPRAVEERFEISQKLGSGGMGAVFSAFDRQLKRKVALKVTLPELLTKKEVRQRFKREVKILAKLNHSNVVSVYDYYEGQQDQASVYTMELIGGRTLLDVRLNGSIPPAEACEIIKQLADGLSHMHQLGIIHRDIKPANVVITDDGVPKFIDFGLSRSTSSKDITRLTQEGCLMGTMFYMPPEVFTGFEVDERGDLYQLGLVLLELITGCQPLEEARADEIINGEALDRVLRSLQKIPLAAPFDEINGLLFKLLGQKEERPTAGQLSQGLFGLLKKGGKEPTREDLSAIILGFDETSRKSRVPKLPKIKGESANRSYLPLVLTTVFLLLIFFVLLSQKEQEYDNPLAVYIERGKKLSRDDGCKSWVGYAKLLQQLESEKRGLAFQWNEVRSSLNGAFHKESPAGFALAAIMFERENKVRRASHCWCQALEKQLQLAKKEKITTRSLFERTSWLLWRYVRLAEPIDIGRDLLIRCSHLVFQLRGKEVQSDLLGQQREILLLAWALQGVQDGNKKYVDDVRPALRFIYPTANQSLVMQNVTKKMQSLLNVRLAKKAWPAIKFAQGTLKSEKEWVMRGKELIDKASARGGEAQHFLRKIDDMIRWRQMKRALLEKTYYRSARKAAFYMWLAYGVCSKSAELTRNAFNAFTLIHREQAFENALPGGKEQFAARWKRPFYFEDVIELACQSTHYLIESIASEQDLSQRLECEYALMEMFEDSFWDSSHDFTHKLASFDKKVATRLKGTIVESYYRARRAMSAQDFQLALQNFQNMRQRIMVSEKEIHRVNLTARQRNQAIDSLANSLSNLAYCYDALRLCSRGGERLELCQRNLDYLQSGKRFQGKCLHFRCETLLHLVDCAKRSGDRVLSDKAQSILQPILQGTNGEQIGLAKELLAGKPLPIKDQSSRRQLPMKF